MTSAPTFSAAGECIVDVPRRMHGLRRSSRGQWLGHPLAYTFGTIVASILSIGTTLVAPSLLGPAAFGSFALLTSLFQYASRFDRVSPELADRQLLDESGGRAGRRYPVGQLGRRCRRFVDHRAAQHCYRFVDQ